MSKTVIAPGTETCGCCEGIDASTPQDIDNRPGLSAIAYRIGEYAQFKESMLAGLSSSSYHEPPGDITSASTYPLSGLRTRDADDFTLGLIDAVACAADVLTFYQERVANESYLRTATERVSLQEMARLIGYRLRPGVAAETWLAFALETPKTPPPGLSRDPGAFVTGIPTSLTLPQGLQVRSVPGPGETPQTFETVEEIVARPEWNAMRPWLSAPHALGAGATDMWVEGVANNLRVGDALLFVSDGSLADPTTDNNWDFRLIASVELDAANDRTHVRWQLGLGSGSPLSNPLDAQQVYVLRKRVGVFGNNAPMWLSMNSQFRGEYPGGSADPTMAEWPDFTISPADHAANASGGYVDLDVVLGEVPAGGFAVLASGDHGLPDQVVLVGTQVQLARVDVMTPRRPWVHLYQVTSTIEVSRAEFAISGKVTRLGLAGKYLPDLFAWPNAVRETSVYVQSELLTLAAKPETDAIKGDQLPLAVSAAGLEVGRRLIIHGDLAGGGHVVYEATISSLPAKGEHTTLTIAPPLPFALKRDTVVVHANVALATHGETVAQILGAGDASQSFQRFELKRLPLTYRSATNETGADSELTVRIGDVKWAERPTMFGATPAERAYTLETDEQGKAWVVFGDGTRGARLPSGVNNVRASYRQGLGQDGNVGADTLTQLTTRPLGLKSVSNPVQSQGGTDPEPADQARRTMPLGTRTLGRAVSLLDYEDFAMAFTGIAKAQARVLHVSAGPTVAITVAGQDGAVLSGSNPVWNNLWIALKACGDPYVNVALLSYQPRTFRLGLKVKRDADYELKPLLAAVEAALRAHYSFESRLLGQPVFQSDVIAVVHAVPGVVAVDLDFLYEDTLSGAPNSQSLQTRLLASRMRVSGGLPLPAELLTLNVAPLVRLEELT